MPARTLPMVAAALLALAACNPFARKHAVQISSGEVSYSKRWNASLATPAELAGAIQVHGSAWMAPGQSTNTTLVNVSISNAAPGGVHPWHVHRGQCGNDQGIVGQASDYPALRVGNDGTASAQITLPLPMPSSGSYFVNVHASPTNMGTSIACGNMAPPVE